MATNREDIRQAAHNWITKYFWNDSVDKPRLLSAFEAGVLHSEDTLSIREKNCKELEEENKRLKEQIEHLKIVNPVSDKLTEQAQELADKDREIDKLKLECSLDYADLVRERENVKTLRGAVADIKDYWTVKRIMEYLNSTLSTIDKQTQV